MRKGFTLIEVMLAGAILALGCVGVLGMLLTVINQNSVSKQRTEAMYLAEILLERIELQAKLNPQGNDASLVQWHGIHASQSVGWEALPGGNTFDADGNTFVAGGNNNRTAYLAHYKTINNTDQEFIQGAIRVGWSKPGRNCTATALGDWQCEFVSLPFVLRANVSNDTSSSSSPLSPH